LCALLAGLGASAHAAAAELRVGAPVAPQAVTVPPPPPSSAPRIPASPGSLVTVPEGEPLPPEPPPPRQPVDDPVIQLEEGETGEAPRRGALSKPIVNIPGLTADANPPDTVGDVGTKHYVQMVNATEFKIWNKRGRPLTGPIRFGSLWPDGEICNADAGDPIVVFDHLADRWLLSQFADPHHMCIAISRTPDPTKGTWFLYTFDTFEFPDYPKFGVWPNGYYMSTYEGDRLGIYAFDRARMLTGNPAGFLKTTIDSLGAPGVRDTRILPADLDGPKPPGGNPPNPFVRTVDDQQDPGNREDRIEIFEVLPNFGASTLGFRLVDTLRPAPFQTMLCDRNGEGIRDCIPQPTVGTNTVDALSNRPMMQLKYRNLGSSQALVFNQTIDVSGAIAAGLGFTPAEEVAGIRWYELRKPRRSGSWTIRQQGTFAPQPEGISEEGELVHRWMGSAAIDRLGNIALGFSITNGDPDNPIFPGIRYNGRLANDPRGRLPQGGGIIETDDNAQTQGLGARWGDYSALSVDPVDDCTFWYTNHLAGRGGDGPRPTRIGSFKFSNCTKKR
jgi:hypothetical protein